MLSSVCIGEFFKLFELANCDLLVTLATASILDIYIPHIDGEVSPSNSYSYL